VSVIIDELSIPAHSRSEPAWRMFHSNQAIWKAVLELCASARESLDLEQYIFSPEGIGRELLDILTAKAGQGVRVRLLVDGYGSFGLAQGAPGLAFRKAGGEMVSYNSLAHLFRNPLAGVHRLHRKSVLCDRRRMMVGGSCYDPRMADWRDTMVLVEGTITRAAERAFETAWRYGRREQGRNPRAVPDVARVEAENWSYLTSEPQRPTRQEIYQTLLKKLRTAQSAIALTTPYLAPDRKIWSALGEALERGVDVRLLFPQTSDHPSVDILSQFFAGALSRRGVKVFAYKPGMMHAKIAIIDDWAMVSSFNLDILSIGLNVENGIASRSPAFRQRIDGHRLVHPAAAAAQDRRLIR